MELKQVIVVRTDLKMPKGKTAVQAAHASVEAVLKSLKHNKTMVETWRKHGMKKVVLKVENEQELIKYMQCAKDNGLITAMITDAGRTIVEPGTKTCIAIGPDDEDKIDAVTGNLKML